MRFTRKHAIATVLVAATVIPYLGYAIRGEMPFIQDARGMGALGVILGAIAWFVLGAEAFGPRWFSIGAGLLAAGLGVAAAILETGTAATWLLAGFIVIMVGLWVTALVRTITLIGQSSIERHA